MKLKYNFSPSLIAVLFIFLFCVFTAHRNKIWCGDGASPFCYDIKQYYSYLPQFLIEHDIDFTNRGDYWLDSLPNGNVFIKYSNGVAILEAPFFLLAWSICLLFKIPVNGGYNSVFYECIHYGVFLYFLLGLLSLRKVLQYFKFNEYVIAITLLCVFFGTNLFHYILGEGLMSHGFLFSLHCIFLYLIIKFYDQPNILNSMLIGFVGGLIALIRPTEILCFLVFLLWEINSWKLFKNRILFFLHKYHMIIVMMIIFIIVWIPQMLYWKHVSGSFLFYAYKEEKLLFDSPKFIQILFSPRNGLIPYSPIVFIFLISLFFKNSLCKSRLALWLFVWLNIYLVSCWWCWWYGGSFGARALIQIYPYLAISFAGLLQLVYLYRQIINKLILYSFSLIIILSILLHLKFWYQKKWGYLHHDSMSCKAYWYILPKGLLSKDEVEVYFTLLDKPSYDLKERNNVK
ncbi:MAG: hypothetical protein U0W65_14935 [Bacteroidia bacterium]